MRYEDVIGSVSFAPLRIGPVDKQIALTDCHKQFTAMDTRTSMLMAAVLDLGHGGIVGGALAVWRMDRLGPIG